MLARIAGLFVFFFLHATASLSAGELPPELEAGPRILLVTPGGIAIERAEIEKALKEKGASVVMGPEALGDMSGKADKDFLRFADDLPVDSVLVIRRLDDQQVLVTKKHSEAESVAIAILPRLVEAPVEKPTEEPNVEEPLAEVSEVEVSTEEQEDEVPEVEVQEPPEAAKVHAPAHPGLVLGVLSGVGLAAGVGLGFVGLMSGALEGRNEAVGMAIAGGVLVAAGTTGLIWAINMDPAPAETAVLGPMSERSQGFGLKLSVEF